LNNGLLLSTAPALPHSSGTPSAWLLQHAALLAPGATVLDVACGSGRNLRWLVQQGFVVTGIDRDAAALQPLQAQAEVHVADIENAPWPLPHRRFGGVLVANYLWRPLWPQLLAALAPGGVFIMETFGHGQQHIGKPSRPDFLLQPGELLQVCKALRVVAFEDGFEGGFERSFEDNPADSTAASPGRYVQRIVAVNEGPATALAGGAVPRYGLASRAR
jgi:SAM-dependent methyltransferase